MVTTVWEEKKFNPRLSKSVNDFVEIMNSLNLAYPKQIGWWLLFFILELGSFFLKTSLYLRIWCVEFMI